MNLNKGPYLCLEKKNLLKIPRRNKLPNKNKFHLLISFLILIICQEIFHVYIPNSCTTSLEAFCLCICLNVGICSLILKICLAGCGRLATFHLLVGRDSCLFRWYALSNLNSFTLIPPYNIIPSSLNGKCNNCQTNRSAVLLFVLSPSKKKKKNKTPGNSRIFLVMLFVSLSVLLCFKQDLSSSLKLCCVVFVHLFPCFLENFNDECLTGAKNVLVFSRFRWVFLPSSWVPKQTEATQDDEEEVGKSIILPVLLLETEVLMIAVFFSFTIIYSSRFQILCRWLVRQTT